MSVQSSRDIINMVKERLPATRSMQDSVIPILALKHWRLNRYSRDFELSL